MSDTQLVPVKERYENFRGELMKRRAVIQKLLPKHVGSDRLVRVLLNEAWKTPKLLECTPNSLWSAVYQSAQLGLEIGGALGHCYLIPYGKECTFVGGYRGYVELAHRSGRVATISAEVVYEGDEFDYELGTAPYIKHRPGALAEKDINNPDAIRAAYATIGLKGTSERMFRVMRIEELLATRNRSRAGRSGPWVDHFAEMARKTPLRKLMKLAPMTADVQRLVALDDAADSNMDQDFSDVIDVKAEEAPPQTLDELKARASNDNREPGAEG